MAFLNPAERIDRLPGRVVADRPMSPVARRAVRPWLPSLAALAVLSARVAGAHSEPVLPSLCTFAPFDLSAPGIGLTGSAAAAGPADTLREVYDIETSAVTFCPADPANPADTCATSGSPRAFTLGSATGTITFPATFVAAMLATGDLTAVALPLAVDAGGGPVSVPVLLTTGLVASAGGAVAEGSPIDTDGHVTFVGTGTGVGLPAPLAGAQIGLRMSCTLAPAPDLDQFSLTPTITKTTGRIAAGGATVKLAVTLPPGQTSTFAGTPALLRLHVGDTAIGAVALPAGLTGVSKRKLHGTAADGAEITVQVRSATRYLLTAHLPAATLPAGAGSKVSVSVTQDVGGLLARTVHIFKANPKRTVLRAG
jgi:hypothetical protein